MMRLTRVGYLLTLVVTFFYCALSARAQILAQNERFNPLKITTTGTIKCATNTGIPIDVQLFADPDDQTSDYVPGPTAAVKGATITAKALMNIPGPFREGEVTLIDASYNGIPLTAMMNPVPIDEIQESRHEFTITIGPLPNYVYSGDILVNLKTTEKVGTDTVVGHATVLFHLYTIYAQPTAPQAMPWIGVLDDACIFSRWQSNEAWVSKELTIGVHFGSNNGLSSLRYFKARGDAQFIDSADGKFMLTTYLQYTGETPGNCVDVNTYLAICANALGLNFSIASYNSNNPSSPTTHLFATTDIREVGVSWGPTTWSTHTVAHSSGESIVHDAFISLRYDLVGFIMELPPSGWLFTSPPTQPQGNYWQFIPISPILRGLVSSPIVSTPNKLSSQPILDVK